MRWLISLILALSWLPAVGQSTAVVNGYCTLGGAHANVSGLMATNFQQGIIPGCTVTVYLHGTTNLATIYADDSSTPLSNPFTAVVATSPNSGFWIFWAATGSAYDVVASGGTAPITYPAPLTIWEEFLGAGGGGGGNCPVGVLYDIQIFASTGNCGSDSGIGQINPTTHTITEQIASMSQQVNVSDTTHSGQICQGHSTGSAVDAAFCTQPSATFSPTPTGGYGLFPPDNSPTGVGNVVTISSITPTMVTTQYGSLPFFPTHFVTSVSGLVNAENLEYLFTTPCNLVGGSPCTDITFTPVPFAPSDSLMGPPQNTGNLGYLTNSAVAQDNTGSLSTATVTLPNVYTTGSVLVAQITGDASGSVSTPTDSCGNTWTVIHASGDQGDWYVASAVKCLTADVISVALGATGGYMIGAGEVINGGALDASVQGGSCSGSSPYTITYASLTTSVPDILVVLDNQQGPGGGPVGTYTPGTGFTTEAQSTHYGGGGLGDSRSMMLEWGPALSAGSNHATSVFTQTSGGTDCAASNSFTLAFKPLVSTLPGYPTPRIERYADLAQADFPAIASGNAGQALIVDPTGTRMALGSTIGSGTVTSFSAGNLSPLFTTSVANGTTTPALSFILSSFSADNILGNFTAGSAAPSTQAIPSCAADGSHALTYASHTLGCTAVTGIPASSVPFSGITGATNTSAAMVVGSGATLATTSATAGVISANQINGTALSGLSTGFLFNTTSTGVPSVVAPSGTKCYPFGGSGGTGCDSPGAGGTPVYKSEIANYTILSTDFTTPSPACGTIVGSGTITIKLPSSAPTAGTCVFIYNAANTIITIDPNGVTAPFCTISNCFLYSNMGLRVVSDGTEYQVQKIQGGFDNGNGSTFYGESLNGATNTNNTYFGINIGASSSSGTYGTIVGRGAGANLSSGNDSVFVGEEAGKVVTTGSDNTIIGILGGANIQTGSNNTLIGARQGNNNLNSGNANLLVGANLKCDTPSSSTSNYLCLGDLIYGDVSKGILILKGTTTTITSNACGSTSQGTLKSGSNDMTGEVTVGTATVTSCAVTFANTHNAAPNCVVSSQVAGTVVGFGYTVSTTALTITATSGLDSTKFDYFCPAGATSASPTP